MNWAILLAPPSYVTSQTTWTVTRYLIPSFMVSVDLGFCAIQWEKRFES